ncbi:hypothetical protein Tco_0926032 [Tanacetum coccineum]|uniref:Uncharacterized protein n=1 Tax=Tanacetum coccineum TaxID=301880 RepID=A0ABQ5DAL7_9ASTR
MASFKVLETQFQMFINSQIYLNDEYIVMTRNYFLEYTRLDIPEFRDTLIQNMDYVKKSIEKRALHKMEYDSRVNERLTQTTEEKVDSSKALDASLVIIESNGTESQEYDTSSRLGNDAHVDDVDIRPIYNEEPMAEVQTTAEINIFATGQHYTEQPEFNNEGEVDQNTEQCHEIRPLPAKLTDNTITELSNQLLESENVCLKKTVAHQLLNEKSNEAKVKNDIDVTETINIKLEHSVDKLLAENEQLHKEKEHLKQTYKDLFDSIKRTRVQIKRPNYSLMAQLIKYSNENVDVLAQYTEKGVSNAALKNEFRNLTGTNVNTKFLLTINLGETSLQPHKEPVRRYTTYSLKYKYIVQSYKGRTQSLVAEKTDISKNRASRNFNLMIIKWCLLKITLQAPFLNVQKTFDHSRSSLGLYGDDVCSHQFRPLKFKAGSKSCSLRKQDSYITTRVGITIPPSHSNAEDNRWFTIRINPMIQPEPEDLPKDNPKLEIAVLRWQSAPASEY